MVVGVVLALAPLAAPDPSAAAPTAALAPRAKVTRIAVLDVQSSGNLDRKTVEGLSSLLASEVARRPSLSVLAGSDLRSLVGYERQKQLLGCTESGCMAELVGALGVAYLVSSEVSKVGTSWLFSLTLLDAGKSVAVSRLTRRAFSDDELVDQAPGAVDELLGALPGLPAPPPRANPLPATRAAGPESLAGFHEHDGFYLRMLLGYGALSTKGDRLDVSGTAGAFAVAAGAAIGQHLVVYGEIFDAVDSTPSFKVDGAAAPAGAKVDHSVMGYGVGAAWYFMPANAYLGATLGFGQTTLKKDTTEYSTKYGLLGHVTLGKEWWVSPSWGLGIALDLMAGSMKSGATVVGTGASTGTFTTTGASLAFSATFN